MIVPVVRIGSAGMIAPVVRIGSAAMTVRDVMIALAAMTGSATATRTSVAPVAVTVLVSAASPTVPPARAATSAGVATCGPVKTAPVG